MLRFSKPKGPGFGISGGFYLSVLATHARLPSMQEVINPKGEGGALMGYGVPMAATATKDSLDQPLVRGAYGMLSKDRKTAFQMLVLNREESGFDPEAVARHSQSLGLEGEVVARIRATWSVLQFRITAHDPDVYPSLDFILALCLRLGTLCEGVIADPLSERYLLPHQLFRAPRVNPLVDAREHVNVLARGSAAGVHSYTRGMQKFAQPEFELQGLEPGSEVAAERLLIGLAQSVLEGRKIDVGARVGKFELAHGGLDRGLWEGLACLELVPSRGLTVAQALTESLK
jgi:hypothetical protein